MTHKTRRICRGVAAVALLAAPLTGCTTPASPESSVDDSPPVSAPSPSASEARVIEVSAELGALEDEFAARVGVYLLDTGTGATVEYRADESFAFASTIKAVLAGVALDAVPPEVGSEVITYNAADIVSYSPITEKHLDTGMTLQELAHAAMAYSDNTAANLLFAQIGGPAALQSALRALGDTTTSSDRIETELNEWAPGETRDTSTPRAMAQTLQKMVLGDALREDTRAFLLQTLRDNTTGDELIRAGAPEGWTVGDKSGASEHGGRNDIAILERPDGAPVVLAIYSNRLDPAAAYDNGLVAQAARIALNALLG